MSYHRIYIAKLHADKFKAEGNKSGLVNYLLEKHYSAMEKSFKKTIITPQIKA